MSKPGKTYKQEKPGQKIIGEWLERQSMHPFSFQQKTWEKYAAGYSGLVVAPTGFGKTYSVFLAVLMDYLNHPEKYGKGLKLMWITPLRSLSKDLVKAMQRTIDQLGLDWVVGLRTGDITPSEKQKQNRNMPDVLVITPESVHLMFSQKAKTRFFSNLKCIAVDEWHELLGSKRGVLVELAIAHLKSLSENIRVWALTATIGNLDQALEVLVPRETKKIKIKAKEKKNIKITSLLPDELETLPWGGHMGAKMVSEILPVIQRSKSTLVFTNTRNQAEMWYMNLLDADPDLAGQIAIHHGSIEPQLRNWIEDNLASGYLKAVVSTSSLDLGIDFKPVDTVIQIGSPKGVARFLQRAGRSGHSPFETSKIFFVPTQSLELIEAAALKEAYKRKQIENREPVMLPFDVLIQFVVTLAVGEGFYPEQVKKQIKATFAFADIADQEWEWVLNFITRGGETLSNYEEFHKVEIMPDGLWKVDSRRIAMLHRMNIGVIVSDKMMRVKFYSGGYVGMIEEFFITRLKKGDAFILAGRVLELVAIKENDALVKISKKKNAMAVSYMGGRLPLTTYMSELLREKFTESLQKQPSVIELKFLKPLLEQQGELTAIPTENEFLVEHIENKYGKHLFFYPFEGRQLHEIMAAIIAWRIAQIHPISFSIAMNDYGFELATATDIKVGENDLQTIFSTENLTDDLQSSINAAEMAKRKFRDIAVISGLVIQNLPSRQHKFKNIQSSSNLIFKVLNELDTQNLLLRQSYSEVFNFSIEETRLRRTFKRISESKILYRRSDRFTPLSFPIKVESIRQSFSNEDFETRIRRMQQADITQSKKKHKTKDQIKNK